MKNKFFISASILSNNKQLCTAYNLLFAQRFFLFIFLFTLIHITAFAQDTDYEVVDKEDQFDLVCWPAKITSRTLATTDRMITDTIPIPGIGPSAGGAAPLRRLFNAVLVPNVFPNPDTAEIFDLLGNLLTINGTTILFDTSAEAAIKAQAALGGGGSGSNFHWVGYKSNFFQPDNIAVYYYNIFHRWYSGMPCHHQSYGSKQWNGDNTTYANYSDTTFIGHPESVSILNQVSCFGASDGIIKVNANPANPYIYTINGTTSASATFTGLPAGTYQISFTDSFANHCDTTIILPQPASLGSKTTVSNCGMYVWPVNGASYNTSGIYLHTTLNATCVQRDTLQLSITTSTTNQVATTSYNFYTWPVNGVTYTASGNYFFPSTVAGCQTINILNLTIINSNFNMNLVIDQEISCFGNNDGSIQATAFPASVNYTYILNGGMQINNTGFFQGLPPGTHTVCVTHGSIAGNVCKTVTLTNPPLLSISIITDSLVSCKGNDGGLSVYITGGTQNLQALQTYWTNAIGTILNPFPNNTDTFITGLVPGVYHISVEDDHGCIKSETKILPLSVPLQVSATAAPIKCNNGTTQIIPTATSGTPPYSFTMFGFPLQSNYQAGTYTITATDSRGCSATTIIDFGDPAPLTSINSATACNSYYWSMNGTTYTTSGNYVAVLTTLSGCIIVNLLQLTIHQTTTSTNAVSACNSYTWTANNITYTSSGVYTKTSLNPSGCLHTATLNLTIYQSTTNSKTATACNSYNWTAAGANNPYTASGNYTATSINAQGCLHTATLSLTIYQNTSNSNSVTACNSYTWIASGLTYTSSGIYTATGINAQGCVHTQTLLLTINIATSSTQSVTACNSYTWPPTTLTYTASGAYSKTSINAQGCTHTQILQLLIKQSSSSNTSVTASNSYTWNANSITYTNSGIYTATLLNAAGCDSMLTLQLSINQVVSILNIRCFIEGYMESANNMKPVLMNQMRPSLSTTCDTILVELRSPTLPHQVLHQTKAILQRNGFAVCTFPLLNANFYIAVKHRNAIQTWSAAPVAIGSTPTNYNFTTNINKAYGSNQILVSTGVWAFYSGDIDQEENIDLLDINLLEAGISNFESGYKVTDIDGDGSVDLLDLPSVESNLNDFIFSKHP